MHGLCVHDCMIHYGWSSTVRELGGDLVQGSVSRLYHSLWLVRTVLLIYMLCSDVIISVPWYIAVQRIFMGVYLSFYGY